jgi:hypothetical protein
MNVSKLYTFLKKNYWPSLLLLVKTLSIYTLMSVAKYRYKLCLYKVFNTQNMTEGSATIKLLDLLDSGVIN